MGAFRVCVSKPPIEIKRELTGYHSTDTCKRPNWQVSFMSGHSKDFTSVQQIELLATKAGRIGGHAFAILTIRPSPEVDFSAINVAFTKAQAERLIDDLIALFETSEFLRED